MPADPTVLVIIDAQNAFLATDGSMVHRGFGIPDRERIRGTILQAVQHYQLREVPVVCTKLEFRADYADAGLLVNLRAPEIRQRRLYQAGTHDSELFTELSGMLGPRDRVVTKTRYDAFLSPDFQHVLQEIAPRRFVVAGVVSNVCVESFVRSAFDRDYPVTVLADATGSYSERLHLASLRTMGAHFATISKVSDLADLSFSKAIAPRSELIEASR